MSLKSDQDLLQCLEMLLMSMGMQQKVVDVDQNILQIVHDSLH